MECIVINPENEIWKTVNYEGLENYEISTKGRIRNKTTGIILKFFITNNGYYRVNLHNRALKCQKKYAPHILEGLTFIENPLNKPIINHKDGNKLNLDVDNLEWATYSENLSHAYKIGLRNENGKNNPRNVYPEKLIHRICQLLEKGKTNIEVRNEIFGVNLTSDEKHKYRILIGNIQRREKWITISKNYKW